MIMNTAIAVAMTELFVTPREAGSSFIVLAQCCRLKVSKNVSVSALQGLGLGLVSWQISDVSVSSRSRKLRSRLHPCLARYKYLTNCSRLFSPTSPFSHAHTRTHHQPYSSPPGLAQWACYKKGLSVWVQSRLNTRPMEQQQQGGCCLLIF